MLSLKRLGLYVVISAIALFLFSQFDVYGLAHQKAAKLEPPTVYRRPQGNAKGTFDWAQRVEHFPVTQYAPIPAPLHQRLPAVQHDFRAAESSSAKSTRIHRQTEIKSALQRCWTAYKQRAWLHDELTPLSGESRDPFGGWAATLVDTLDTLWIMGLKDEFAEAVQAVVQIDFTKSSQREINMFETTIRYLGGLLSAYDLSGEKQLLDKGLELADMLYAAFDTPNRMPITRWDFQKAMKAEEQQVASESVLVAEIGSLCLEFTRLAQITHDPKWYDATARITDAFEKQQDDSNIPGMWPMAVNARDKDFASGTYFTLGAMADSLYEYLPKMYALLGGSHQFGKLYAGSMSSAIRSTVFRPMVPGSADILMTGGVNAGSDRRTSLNPEGQHLSCFAGGMLALGGRLTNDNEHVEIGRKLTEGCIWAYDASALGIMPEVFTVLPCQDKTQCSWNEAEWLKDVSRRASDDEKDIDASVVAKNKRLPPGFTSMGDRRYILRPEAIESVFILHRITGDPKFQEAAWRMFTRIQEHTKTEIANAALSDMSQEVAIQSDSMESFWTAETLKYFYLTFSDPSLISLDEYVFNTEAHPLKRTVTSH